MSKTSRPPNAPAQPPRIVGDDGEFVFELPVPPAPERPSEISSLARTIELRAGWLVLMMLVVAGAIALLMMSRIPRPTPTPHRIDSPNAQQLNALRPINMADVSDCSFARMPLSRMPIVLASGDPVSGRSSLYLLSSGAKCRLDINTTAFEPRWMPDEERILYAGIQGSRRDLFIWSFPQEISTLTTSSRSELGAVWAPDGRSVYFVAGEALQRLQMTTESPLASPQRVMNSFVAPEIAISPDGQSIAFISSQTARTALELVIDQELHISRLDGTGLRRLTYNTVRDSEPAWSSDGRWIAWVSDGQIWLYDLVEDASLPFTARSGFLASNPVWLPTGDGIAFIVQTANTRALVAQMFSGEFRIINGQFNRLTSFDWR